MIYITIKIGVLSMKKLIIFICSLTIIITSLLIPVSASNYVDSVDKDMNKLNCKVDLLISLDDGSVVVERNADTPVAPASLTKIMTALVVLKNRPETNQIMTVQREAIEVLAGTGSSTSGLKSGEQISIYNMLCCLLIPSGNDAATALAIEVGGSIDGFVKMMNDLAAELGCKNTHFDNPHGLITKEALKYPVFETIVATNVYNLPETNMNKERQIVNTNFLISPYRVTYYNKDVKGIKTGSTEDAGKCLIAHASRNGYNYLSVAMGGDYRDTDNDGIEENQAFMDTNKMFNWAFRNLKYEIVTQEGQFVCSVPLNYCWDLETIKLVALDEVMALVPQGNDSQSVSFQPYEVAESIDAPVKKGDKLGKAKVIFAGQQIGTVDLVASEDARMSVFLYIRNIPLVRYIFIAVIVLIVAYIIVFIIANQKRKKKRAVKMYKYNEHQKSAGNNKRK